MVKYNLEMLVLFQDVQHLDIDTLDERKDFTFDSISFKGLPEFNKEIRAKGIKTFMILVRSS